MKRFLCLLFVFSFLPVLCFADLPDLSGLSFVELSALREQLNLLLWSSREWKQVEVPSGVYQIGVDIPAGHWTLKPPAGESCVIEYFQMIDGTGKRPADVFNNYYSTSIADESSDLAAFVTVREMDLVLNDGYYLSVSNGPSVIFEPFVSKPAFSFSD